MEDVKKKLCRFHRFCGAHKIGACVLSDPPKKTGARPWPRPGGSQIMFLAVLHILLIRLVELLLHHQMVLQLLGGEGLQKPEGG